MAGKSGKSVDYKINLTFNTKDSDKQFQAVADRMKDQIRAIATETNKTKYFTGLEQTIKDVDSQLDALRDKHGDSFDGLFGGLDDTIRQQFSSVFDYAKQRIEELRREISGLTDSKSNIQGVLDKYNKYSKSVNQLVNENYFGKISGFEKIDKSAINGYIQNFDQLLAKKREFENIGDTKSLAYLQNYVDLMEAAAGIQAAYREGFNVSDKLNINTSDFLSKIKSTHFADVFNPLQAELKGIEGKIAGIINSVSNNISQDILSQFFGGTGGNTGIANLETASKLIEKLLIQYKSLNKAAASNQKSLNGIDVKTGTAGLTAVIEMLGDTEDAVEKIENVFYDFSDGATSLSEAVKQILSVINMPESAMNFEQMNVGMENVGKAAETAENKVNSLHQAIKNTFDKALSLEIDVGKGKSDSKEYMNLFGADGMISEATGAYKIVDTDTIVSQLISNLKNDIVMSLHNHVNGTDTFSAADIKTFAKLYYGQGTKINGIIADGAVKTIDFTGISQELAIRIAESYAKNLQQIVAETSNFLTYNDGDIGYTELAEQLKSTDPETYQDLVLALQDKVNQALNDAFVQNGIEPTIKQFEHDQLQELANYLVDVQKNAQNAIDPVEKLKNLIAALHPDETFDWSKYDSILSSFSSGAIDGTKAISQILSLDSTGNAEAEVSKLDQYKSKLQEFNQIVDEVGSHQWTDTAKDNVEIGKYIAKLEAAKNELYELGHQAGITSEELDGIGRSFNETMTHLDVKAVNYDGWSNSTHASDGAVVDYDDWQNERDRADAAEERAERAEAKLAEPDQSKASQEAMQKLYKYIEETNKLTEKVSETTLGKTDGEDDIFGIKTINKIKQKQQALSDYLKELTKIVNKEKEEILSGDDQNRKDELVRLIQDLQLSVRYKDGTNYSTVGFGDDWDEDLSDQIDKLNQIISLRKKIDLGFYRTGVYGAIEDTFTGNKEKNLLVAGVEAFDFDAEAFNETIIGQLIREYQDLHEQMLKCMLVGDEVPAGTLDKLKWFESLDVSKLESVLPKLTELQNKIKEMDESGQIRDAVGFKYGQDEEYYEKKIQRIQELIALQNEYNSLGGPQLDTGYDDIDYLQKQVDNLTKLKENAKLVTNVKSELKNTFADIDFGKSSDYSIIFGDLQRGAISYADALKQAEDVYKRLQLAEQRSNPKEEAVEHHAEAQAIEEKNRAQERNNKLKAEGNALDDKQDQTKPDDQAGRTTTDATVNKETEALELLRKKLVEVKSAVDAKTQAFEAEYVTVDAAVDAEIESLNRLKELLERIQEILQSVFTITGAKFGDIDVKQENDSTNNVSSAIQNITQLLGQILTVLQGFTGIESDSKNSMRIKEPKANNGVVASETTEKFTSKLSDLATEDTLSKIPEAINELAEVIKIKNESDASKDNDTVQSLNSLINALNSNIKSLQDVMNGVVDHQKAQKSDTSKAMARIQDPKQRQDILGWAKESVKEYSDDIEIESWQALANGLVKVEGAFKNVNGEWEGFTVKINESNKAVDLAIKKHSAFARFMQQSESVNDNPVKYTPDEVYKNALKHMQEQDEKGNKATLQYKDSGRYTVSVKEQVGGLTKETFQTFDEFQSAMSRTTITLSNDISTAIKDTNKLIISNMNQVGNSGLLQQYNDEYARLLVMSQQYAAMDNLGADDIAIWNEQIALVQRLGGEVSNLIAQKQKLDGQSGVATSAKRLQEYQTNADKIFKGLDFGLTSEDKTPAQQKIVDAYDQIIERINTLKKSHSVLTDAQTQEIDALIASLKAEADVYQNTLGDVFKSDRDKKLSKFDLDKAELQADIEIPKSFDQQIKDARSAIENAVDDESLKIAINNWEALKNKIKETAVQQDLYIKKTKETSKTAKTDGEKFTEAVSSKQTERNLQKIIGQINYQKNDVGFNFNSTDLTEEQLEIVATYDKLIVEIDKYEAAIKHGQQAELNGINEVKNALFAQIDAYKQKYNIAHGGKTGNKKAPGATAVVSATTRYNALKNEASDERFAGSAVIAQSLEKYTDAHQRLVNLQSQYKIGQKLTGDQEQEFNSAKAACSKYAFELDRLLKATKKFDGIAKVHNFADDFEDTDLGRQTAISDIVEQFYGAKVSAENFTDSFTKCVFTVDNGDGTFTKMTASLNAAKNGINVFAGETKQATSTFGAFLNEVKGKFKSISAYLISSLSIHELWQVLRQGVTYVKEIDSALTELKKVTDETDASYDKFLQDMSKTGSVIGATVTNLTTMAADWARLGYSMEEAGKLAESTAILLNVSEFDDATAASEALISTMQAFQYTADESQHVVDILNEVGNNYAVSSDGIATALQDSASALMEGGNNLEQATALVAAANRVVQDPSSVGSALRTISLRLRGTSVKILEEMGEETDGVVESTSKLQEKIKALSGVDILTDAGDYKDTYTILKEIGNVWEEMSDIDQAALLELMAGKNRANTLSAILSNMEDLEGAYNDALNAEGSALKENEAYLDSIQGRIDLFNNSVQTMWMNFIDSEVVQTIVDIGTAIIKLIDAMGLIPTAVGGFAAIKSVMSSIKTDFAAINDGSTKTFEIFGKKSKEVVAATIEENVAVAQNSALKEENTMQIAENTASREINQQQTQEGTVAAEQETVAESMSTATKTKDTIATNTNTIATKANTIATKALAVAKGLAKGILIGGAMMLATSAITKIVQAISDAANRMDELTDAAIHSADEVNSTRNSIEDYKEEIDELRSVLDSEIASEQEAYDARARLIEIQDELVSKFDLEAEGINLVTGAINEQIAALDTLSQKSAVQWMSDYNEAYKNAIKEMNKIHTDKQFIVFEETGMVSDTYDGPTRQKKTTYTPISQTLNDETQAIRNEYINGVKQIIQAAGGDIEESTRSEYAYGTGSYDKQFFASFDEMTAEELDAVFSEIQEYLFDFSAKYDVNLDSQINQLAKLREKYIDDDYEKAKELFNEGLQQEAYTKYANEYGAILDAQKKINMAATNEDQLSSIEEYSDSVVAAFKAAGGEIGEDGLLVINEDSETAHLQKFFASMHDKFDSEEFELKVKTNDEELKTNLENIIKESGETGLSSLDNNQIKDLATRYNNGEFEAGPSGTSVDYTRYTKEQVSGMAALQQQADAAGISIEALIDVLTNLGLIESRPEDEVEKLTTTISSIDKLTADLESYNDVLKQTDDIVADNTEVSQEYKDALTELGVSTEDLNECFDDTNPLVVKNSRALKNLVNSAKANVAQNVRLAKSQAQLQYKNIVNQIRNTVVAMGAEYKAYGFITDATLDNISAMKDQIETLKQTIQQYALLEISLSKAASAYDKFEAAKARDAELTYDESFLEMLKTIDEGILNNETGTEAFEYAVKALVPEEFWKDIDDVDEKIRSIHDYLDGNKVFSKFFHVDEESGELDINADNVREFVDYGLSDKVGVFTGDSTNFSLSDDIKGIEDAAKAYGVTEAAILAMFTALEKVDAKWGNILTELTMTPFERKVHSTTQEIAEANSELASAQQNLADGTITLEEYEKIAAAYAEKTASANRDLDQYTQEAKDRLLGSDKGTITKADDTIGFIKANEQVIAAQEEVHRATEELTAAQERYNEAKEEGAKDQVLQQHKDNLDKAVDKVNTLTEEWAKLVKIRGEYPDEAEISLVLTSIDEEIAAAGGKFDQVLHDSFDLDENGCYVIKTDLNIDRLEQKYPGIKNYIALLNQKTEIQTFADTTSAEESAAQLQKTVDDVISAIENNLITLDLDKDAVNNIVTQANKILSGIGDQLSISLDYTTPWGSNIDLGQIGADVNAGSDGAASALGNSGLPNNEHNAVVGELGPEMVVDPTKGIYYTVGDNGTEMVNLPKGAIVYNHKQTEELLKNGHTTRGKYTGGLSFASGNAYIDPDLKYHGIPSYHPNTEDSTSFSNGSSINDGWDDAVSTLTDSLDDVGDAAEEFEETIDWIAIRMEEFEEALSLLSAKLENAATYAEKNALIDEMIAKNKEKYADSQAGSDFYYEKADEYWKQIPEAYKELAKNGAINITDFTDKADEATVEAINKYREYAQQAADLTQQATETITEIRDLAIQKIDNIQAYGEAKTNIEDLQTEKLQQMVDYWETKGEVPSSVYYGTNGGDADNSTGMFENSYKKIEYWQPLLEDMQADFDEAVRTNRIQVGTIAWYEQLAKLYEVDAKIKEARIEIEEFQNAINDIYWDNFENLTNRIGYLKNETQSLIDLMENSGDIVAEPNKKKYEGGTVEYWTADDVKWTDEGLASLGLYAQQMEIAEFEAKQYAEAINDLEKDYADLKYSESEYLEKLDELKSKQYKSIEAYHEAKDAIVELNEARIDMIKEGIEKEIDAYEELIDKKKEELDAEKDLYDFQKSTMEQQKNIADIERRLASLANDNSMSAVAERKKLEAELAEAQYELQDTYYNRSVEDKQNALDRELEDFQTEKDRELTKWEEYLTNVETVVADSLNVIQTNASTIYDTLSSKADTYGLTLSDAILSPWEDGKLAVSDYQDTFDTAMSSTMDQLTKLKEKWHDAIEEMTRKAEVEVDTANEENERYAAAKNNKVYGNSLLQAPNSNSYSNDEPDQPTEKSITVGGKINAGSARIYANSAGGGGGQQYFKNDPIYTVVQDYGDYVAVRHHTSSSGITGFFKKSDIKALASGTTSLNKSGIVNIDELGEELVIRAQNGRLTYMEKGTGVVPADLTSNLMEWGKLDPTSMIDQNRPSITAPMVQNKEVNIDLTYGDILHIEEFHGDDPDEIAKIVAKQFEKHTKDLNNALRKFAR